VVIQTETETAATVPRTDHRAESMMSVIVIDHATMIVDLPEEITGTNLQLNLCVNILLLEVVEAAVDGEEDETTTEINIRGGAQRLLEQFRLSRGKGSEVNGTKSLMDSRDWEHCRPSLQVSIYFWKAFFLVLLEFQDLRNSEIHLENQL
jgi:hypothetical protein